MIRRKYVQIENKNALLELLDEGKKIEKIVVAQNAYKDPKTRDIMSKASAAHVLIEKMPRKAMARRSRSSSNESIIGYMLVDNQTSLKELLDNTFDAGKEPFYLIFTDIHYAQNVAAIFRTAFAAGVNGVITPVQKSNLLTDEIVRISMGTCLRIPIVEMNIFAAIKEIQKSGIQVIALDMEGASCYETDIRGPKAVILGSEDMGVSGKLLERADLKLSIPMSPGLGSLNVSVAAALIMYEKFRQETLSKKLGM